jgi:4'-phosphopantetheinyl transferase EntD
MKEKTITINLKRDNWDRRAYLSSILCDNLEELTSNSAEFLHPSEQLYSQTLNYERRLNSYLMGRHAAKKAIGQALTNVSPNDIELEFGVFHQPIVKGETGNQVEVSISHSDKAAVALAYPTGHPMGIDIEKIDYSKKELFLKQLTSQELALLKDLSITQEGGALLLWSVKEALSKALKSGLAADYIVYETKNLKWHGNHLTGEFVHFAQYRFEAFLLNLHVLAIALPKKTQMDFKGLMGDIF